MGVVIPGTGAGGGSGNGGSGKRRNRTPDASAGSVGKAANDGGSDGSGGGAEGNDHGKKKIKSLKVTQSAKQRLDEMERDRKNLRMKMKWVAISVFLACPIPERAQQLCSFFVFQWHR